MTSDPRKRLPGGERILSDTEFEAITRQSSPADLARVTEWAEKTRVRLCMFEMLLDGQLRAAWSDEQDDVVFSSVDPVTH